MGIETLDINFTCKECEHIIKNMHNPECPFCGKRWIRCLSINIEADQMLNDEILEEIKENPPLQIKEKILKISRDHNG